MNKQLIEPLVGSKIYQDYKRAFSEITGMPMMLRSVESWQVPHRDEKYENPFCAMLAGKVAPVRPACKPSNYFLKPPPMRQRPSPVRPD